MTRGGRSLARFWRRLRRPSFPRLVAASLVVHVVALVLAVWWAEFPRSAIAPPPPPPLIVELPAAAPGRPLVRPEAPAPPPRAAPPAAPARAPRPPEPRPAPPPPPEPPPAAREPAPPPPPAVARPVEPPPAAPAPAPEPAPPPVARALPEPPAPAPSPPPSPAPVTPRPAPVTPEAPPVVAARPPEAAAPAPRPAPERAPAPPAEPPRTEREAPFGGQRFSLLRPEIESLPAPRLPGAGGTRPEGDGAGEAGRLQDGQVTIPLNTPDPRYAEYFLQVKKRIEAHWVYPREAARKDQSGQGLAGFVLKRDGTVRDVQILRSTGFEILDRYLVNAIRLAQPFPPIPERISESALPVSLTYTYILDSGFRIFGFR